MTQQRVPARALSRVGAFTMVGAFAFGPVAFAAAGAVAAVVGARAVLGFDAAWAVFGALAVFAVPSVRHLTWLAASPDDQRARPAEEMLRERGQLRRRRVRGSLSPR